MKNHARMAVGFATTVTAAMVAMTAAANAGETLRLRAAGDIALGDRSEELLHGVLADSADHGTFVIQFHSAVTEEDKAALAAQGIGISGYLPEDALIVRSTRAQAALAKLGSGRVRAVAPFEARWKLSPDLWDTTAALSSRGGDLLLVSVLPDASLAEAVRRLRSLPAVEVRGASGRDVLVLAPRARVTDIARVESVEWVQRSPLIVDLLFAAGQDASDEPAPAVTLTGHESGTRLMGFDAAWSRGYLGEGQIAAVADTGLDSGDLATMHPDFAETLHKGYPMGLGTETWEDSMGHGTHVAGSVTGTGRASDGAFKGGAYRAKLLVESLWSPILDNLAPGSDFNRLIGAVHRDGARIHTNSWGSARSFGEYDMFAARVDEYMWNNPDMLVLFAAGNSGEDKDGDGRIDEGSVGSPATAKNVLSVGASENLLAEGGNQKPLRELRDGTKKWGAEPLASDRLSDNPAGIAAFSSRGPTTDGRLKPEIVAPGTNIVSTRSRHPKASALWGAYDGSYAYAGGTSMATPLTAAAATVAREYLVKARAIASPSAALVKATLIHTARDLFPGQYGEGTRQELPRRRPNVHEGYGRVDMDALTSLGQETRVVDDRTGVALSETRSVEAQVGPEGTLRATLCYTDAPASTSAAKALVNDLDLRVTGPGGLSLGKADRVNNTEMLELSDLAPGTYSVNVTGINVPQGKDGRQPYALAVSAR